MRQIPEEHDPPLFLLVLALGLAIWMVIIAGILLGISWLLNY
jgi:hypothetical protein